MPNPIDKNALRINATMMVRGVITYSRIKELISGEALKADIQEQTRRGRRFPTTDPYCKISICNAQVVYKNPNAAQDPNLKTLEEKWAEGEMYVSAQHADRYPGMNFTIERRKVLPWVASMREGNVVEQFTPEAELANGLDVTLVLRVFRGRSAQNNSVSLDGVICNEPVRYFQQVNLGEYGLTFRPEPAADSSHEEPAPVAQPATGFSAAPQAPAAPVAPAPASPFPPAPAPAVTGQAPVAPAPAGGGIQYDPANDPTRQY